MKNKFLIILFYLFINLFISSNLKSLEIFNFNVSEIEITQNWNLFKGFNGGQAYTNDGVSIEAENFEYNKITTVLVATGNVILKDSKKEIVIKSNQISYEKNKELIKANGNVQLRDKKKDTTITANKISYFRNEQKIIASEKVKLKDNIKNIFFNTENITYLKNQKKIFTKGKTLAQLYSKYKFYSKDVMFNKDEKKLSSNYKTIIEDDNFSSYELGSFSFEIEKEFLKGTDVLIIQNTKAKKGESERIYVKNGFFDLKNNSYQTSDIKINLRKNLFGRLDNDPRLYGVSSTQKNGLTSVKKAVFTSCKKTEKCPPWRLEANKITHDKNKKQLIYDETILKVYDVPVFYFPKFFHPDPTVKRQSGFLQPKLNNSNILGTSISTPYFYAISENKDLTINPILFSNDVKMIQTEYRQKNKDSFVIADFGFASDFKSSEAKEKKNVNHLFARLTKNLKLDNYLKSEFNIFIEKVNKDTYLKIFNNNLSESTIKPKNNDILNSGLNLSLEHKKFILNGGADIYEDLTKNHSDRYQYVFPYYNFSKDFKSSIYGILNLNSKGNNILDNTNNTKTRVINDLSFKMNDKIFENFGLKNNFNFYFKNLNSVGKNVSTYKSSPQVELQSLFELNSELPLTKFTELDNHLLVPRLSLRINPSDMKDHSSIERKININNIYDINRLGIDDSFESGSSLTMGIDYKKENKNDGNNYIEAKLATVFRVDEENNIPAQTTLNKKNSNLFGSINYGFSKYVNLEYNFALDNKIDNFEYNSIGLGFSLNNFVTKFNFIEEDSTLGNTNVFESNSKISFDDSNSLSFKTRRNREISLTEYYDLVYEYKNDCLTAGIRFNKTYYEDRDLKPSQNIMFTVNFYPLTSIDQSLK